MHCFVSQTKCIYNGRRGGGGGGKAIVHHSCLKTIQKRKKINVNDFPPNQHVTKENEKKCGKVGDTRGSNEHGTKMVTCHGRREHHGMS